VPDWSASLTGHASVQAPREFAATVSIADLAAERLAMLAGGQHSEQVAGGAVSATLEAGGVSTAGGYASRGTLLWRALNSAPVNTRLSMASMRRSTYAMAGCGSRALTPAASAGRCRHPAIFP